MSDFNIQFEEQDQSITLEFEQIGGGAVKSVNGKVGEVVLGASDVGALPSSTSIPAVDNTLTVAGAAADAKKTGDELYTLKEDLQTVQDGLHTLETEVDITDTAKGGFITDNVNVGEVVNVDSINSSSQWKYIVQPTKAGEWFEVTGTGGGGARLWVLTDKNFKLIAKSDASVTQTDYKLSVNNDGYAVFNLLVTNAHSVIHHQLSTDRIELTNWFNGYIVNKGTVGYVFTGTKYNYASNWVSQFIRVKEGETYWITAQCGSSAVGYAVFSNDFTAVMVSNPNVVIREKEVNITTDGFMIVNALTQSPYKVTKKRTEDFSTDFPPAVLTDLFKSVTEVSYNSSTVYTYEDIIAGYDALVSAHPSEIIKTALGTDASGNYTIYRYDFVPNLPSLSGYQNGMGAKLTSDNLVTIFMDACIHGAERPCARALLNLMEKIYTSKDNDIFAWLRSHAKFIIIPVANPYGYVTPSRKNSNGVDLNRNFPMFWVNGSNNSSSDDYRGSAPLSEKEAQYINAILLSLVGKKAFYYSWHTHGMWDSYEHMTCYAYSLLSDTYTFNRIGSDLIPMITESGHAIHDLPLNSGYIGMNQVLDEVGNTANTALCYGINASCPEVMYKYYDGVAGTDYSTKINCMNVEYMLSAVALAYKYLIEG